MIGGIILILIVWLICKIPEWKACNRLTPPGYNTDWAAMNKDMANGASKQQIYTNINSGKYDVPNKK